jgi:protein-tyrosine phosphatase
MLRTSLTHPLQIASLAAPGGGVVGLTLCPGKRQAHAASGAWARDLELDLRAIQAWGAGVLVTLVTQAELVELGVEGLGAEAQALGLKWLHLPLEDATAPTAAWERDWTCARGEVMAELDRGGRMLVHCKGGLGRAGTVAALILVERGMAARAAIFAVRHVRPGAIETAAQLRYVHSVRKAER